MISNFFAFMLSILQSCFSSMCFVLPLGIIVVSICFVLFRRMGGKV